MERDWAHHPISAANNRSTHQLWHYGMTRLTHIDPESAAEAMVNTWKEYGIDEEAPHPGIDTDNDVVIPDSDVQLNEDQQVQLEQTINPLFEDNNEGIDLYQQTISILTHLLSRKFLVLKFLLFVYCVNAHCNLLSNVILYVASKLKMFSRQFDILLACFERKLS